MLGEDDSDEEEKKDEEKESGIGIGWGFAEDAWEDGNDQDTDIQGNEKPNFIKVSLLK